MSGTGMEELAARMAAGESLRDALSALEPLDERELLKRCATVRTFDDDLVEVLRTALPDPPDTRLEDLERAGLLEPVPGRPGSCPRARAAATSSAGGPTRRAPQESRSP